VEVTCRTGDGGIDGRWIIQLAGLISFNVIFQAKRYRQNVRAGTVRDFRGAMQGRADKGLIITTAGFTRDARDEATRDGAPPIDLISGEDLMDLLKDHRIGVEVTTRTVEDVVVNEAWFRSL
jgi:restriction system protein